MVNGKTFGLVTTCMNREWLLKAVLHSWERLMPQYVDQIVIVDWSSNTPLKLENTKATILRVNNQDYYNPGKARNTGIRYCDTHWIFAIDSDVIIQANEHAWHLTPGFFALLGSQLKSGNIYSRDLNLVVDGSLTGSILFEKSSWEKIHGYGENFIGWGFDDIDYHNRLLKAKFGFQRIFNQNYLHHIPHDDFSRTCNGSDSVKKMDKQEIAEINKNIIQVLDFSKQEQQKQIVDVYVSKTEPYSLLV
jgi:predicted glycosyltransferase involved in capsule biosynthesis